MNKKHGKQLKYLKINEQLNYPRAQPHSDEAIKNDVVEENSKTQKDVYAKFSIQLKKKKEQDEKQSSSALVTQK